jgi:phage terminase small subunit
MASLSDKQRAFVAEYLVDLNAAAAYQRAGYKATGGAARANASRLLTNANVAQAISEAFKARIERTEITADRVLLEYARIAFSEMRQFAEWGPDGVTWKDSEELSEAAAACVAEVSETVSEGGRTRRFKLHSKTSALQDLAKHLGLFGKDGNASGVNVNVNIDNRPTRPLSDLTEEELDFYERILDSGETATRG